MGSSPVKDVEVQKLRRALSDIAALSSLPAIWADADERQIAESLAEAVVRVMDLDAIRLSLQSRSGEVIEIERCSSGAPAGLGELLDGVFPAGDRTPGAPRELLPGGRWRALCVGVGVTAESRLYAVSGRDGFPSQAERLTLVMVANQAAVALQRAAAEQALRAQTEALNRERDAVAALNRSLSNERDKLRLLFEQAPGFMAVLRGPHHIFDLCNESYFRLFGRRDFLGQSVRQAFPELAGQGFFERLDEAYATGIPHMSTGAPIDLQRTPGGPMERRYLDFIYQPVFDEQARVIGIFAEGHDVTEQIQAAAHRQLLVNELNHRVKNTLATVQSMAHQTLRGAASLADAQGMLTARLVSLSNAHNVLTRENWSGADISEIVAEALRPHDDPRSPRVLAQGPPIRLDARSALALSMALHELATNAAKYGALSNDTGVVRIDWSADPPAHVILAWRESGGPPVLAPPARRGFGSRLLQSGLSVELGAAAEIVYAPPGLVCTMRAPTAAPLAAPDGPDAPSDRPAADRSPAPEPAA
ncbi:MAG: hypothetical protein JWQ29_1386 [Phenylobacterium sp.]|nr:hypothetical protein [Phenylobacterium sp.]